MSTRSDLLQHVGRTAKNSREIVSSKNDKHTSRKSCHPPTGAFPLQQNTPTEGAYSTRPSGCRASSMSHDTPGWFGNFQAILYEGSTHFLLGKSR